MSVKGRTVWKEFVKNFGGKYVPGVTSFVKFLNRFKHHSRLIGTKLNDNDKGEILRLCLNDTAGGTVEGYYGHKDISRQLKTCVYAR